MRLLFLNRSFWPDVEATGQLLAELSTDLAQDHHVSVIAGPPNYGPVPQRGLFTTDQLGRVQIVRTWGTRLPKSYLLARLVNLASYFALAAIAALRSPRPDVVVAETDPPLLGLLAAVLKKWWRCAFVYYCQDVYPDIARATGGVRNPVLLWVLARANAVAYARADAIVVLGHDMRAHLLSKGVPETKIEIIPNWADCTAIHPIPNNRFRQQFGDQFIVMYSGNFGLSQQWDVVIEAAARMRDDPGTLFVLIGDGARRLWIKRAVSRRKLHNVRLFPYQPKERLAESLSAADLHLIPLRAGAAGCLVPSKVYSILAAGRPFVAMMEEQAEVARIAREYDVGFVTPPDDASALVRIIEAARANGPELAAMGERARCVATEQFDRPLATSRFGALLARVAGRADAREGPGFWSAVPIRPPPETCTGPHAMSFIRNRNW